MPDYELADDRILRQENMEARPFYKNEGIRALWAAVTIRVMKDYELAMKSRNPNIIAECEAFFESEAFACLSGGWGANEVRKAIQKNAKGGKNEGVSIWSYHRPHPVHCPE